MEKEIKTSEFGKVAHVIIINSITLSRMDENEDLLKNFYKNGIENQEHAAKIRKLFFRWFR